MPDNVPDNPTPPPPAHERPLWKRLLPTNWRAIAVWAAFAIVSVSVNFIGRKVDPDAGPILPDPGPPPTPLWPDGWFSPTADDTKSALSQQRVYRFEETPAGDAGLLLDGDAFHWKYAIKARGDHIPTRDQGSVGSCVSFGFGAAVEYSICVQQILKRGPPQDPVDVAQEIIYAGSRVEANGGNCPIRGQDGSTGAWAAKWLTTGGALARGLYGNADHDLRTYSVERCRRWGDSGVPNELEPEAKKNLVTSAALVSNLEGAKKAIQQGYPIAICSSVGFGNPPVKRDANGFATPSGQWMHCMVLIGYRTDIAGFYCLNSWGAGSAVGPVGAGDPPPGGFWIKADVVGKIIGQGDSFAISGVTGFPARKLKPEDWIIQAPRPWRPELALALSGY